MAKNIVITIDAQSGIATVNRDIIGAVGENLQGQFIVEFKGTEHVAGICWLEIKNGVDKGYIELSPKGRIYVAPIKSGITNYTGKIEAQVRITQSYADDEIPIFKSNVFSLKTLESINALEEIPDEYPDWITIVNAKLAEIDNIISQSGTMSKRTYVKQLSKTDFIQVSKASTSCYCATINKNEHGLDNPYIEKAILVRARDEYENYTFDTPVVVGEKTLSTGTVKVYITITDFMEKYEEYNLKIYLKGE